MEFKSLNFNENQAQYQNEPKIFQLKLIIFFSCYVSTNMITAFFSFHQGWIFPIFPRTVFNSSQPSQVHGWKLKSIESENWKKVHSIFDKKISISLHNTNHTNHTNHINHTNHTNHKNHKNMKKLQVNVRIEKKSSVEFLLQFLHRMKSILYV